MQLKRNLVFWLLVTGVIALGIGLSLAPNDSSQPETASTMPNMSGTMDQSSVSDMNSGMPATNLPAQNPTGVQKRLTVTGQNYSFDPKTISVHKGDTVQITFKSVGGRHDLVIDEFNVATQRITSGQEQTITFVADKVGSFEYYCSVGDHRAMGMWGTLTVSG